MTCRLNEFVIIQVEKFSSSIFQTLNFLLEEEEIFYSLLFVRKGKEGFTKGKIGCERKIRAKDLAVEFSRV